MRMVQAEGAAAGFAMEVAVHLLDPARMVVVADTVFRGAAAVVDDMQQVVFGKEGQRAEDRRPVKTVGRGLQVGQTEGVAEGLHRLQHQDAEGRRTYAVGLEHLFAMRVTHVLQTARCMHSVTVGW